MKAARRAGRHAGGSGYQLLADDADAHAVNGEVIDSSVFLCLGDAAPIYYNSRVAAASNLQK